jgi:hypothetical protein
VDITEKLATYSTQEKDKHNVREYRKGNQKWTLQRNWQHRVHKKKTNMMLEIQKGKSKVDITEKLAT